MKKFIVSLLASAVVVGAVMQPTMAQSDRQKDKNNMRNLAAGLGAAAIYEGVNGRRTSATVLGAGAIYAGKKYEDARKAQNRENSRTARYSRQYVYKNGKRVGYYKMKNGRRIGFVKMNPSFTRG
jgi:hypothetical protein